MPLPPNLVLCISSILLFLNCILYNKLVIVSVFLSPVTSNIDSNLKEGVVGIPDFAAKLDGSVGSSGT